MYFDVPNLRHLRMLQTVGQLKCVTSASRELNATQPAVTKAISNFERDIEARLFERRQTGTYPTEVGLMFLRRIERFFEIIETALGAVDREPVPGRRLPGRTAEQVVTGTQMRSLISTAGISPVDVAAQRLGVTTTSLYRSVRELERVLHAPLLFHTASGPSCNTTGQELARQFVQAIQEIEYGRSEVKRAAGGEDAEVVIGALPLAGSLELARAVGGFTKSSPTARVRIVTGDYWSLLNDLRNCRIDMLYGVLRKPEWVTDIVEDAYFRDFYCLVARAQHPLAMKERVTLSDLVAYDWIVPESGTPLRQQIDDLFKGSPHKPHFGIETRSLTLIRALLFNSDLITVLCRSELTFDADIGVLKSIDGPFLGPLSPKGIATRANWLPTETHRNFLDFLRRSAAQANYGQDDAIAHAPRAQRVV